MVRSRARQNRQSGLVPPDFERRMDAHAERFGAPPVLSGDLVRQAAAALTDAGLPGTNPATRPNAAAWRSWAGRLIRGRTGTGGPALTAATVTALLAVADALDRPSGHSHPELEASVAQALD